MSRFRQTFHKLVEDYTGRQVKSIELCSDNHSTAIRAFLVGRDGPVYFLCIDNPPLGRRPALTAIELEEIELDHWPPAKTGTGCMIMGVG